MTTQYQCGPYFVYHVDGSSTAQFQGVRSTSTLSHVPGTGMFKSHGQKGPVITFDGNKINRQWRGDYPCHALNGHVPVYTSTRYHGYYQPRQ
jgi:hypothetical protein